MEKYLIKVNGKEYEVEVEKVGGEAVQVSKPVEAAAKVEAPAKTKSTESPKSHKQGTIGNLKVNSPMPGTILGIKVNVGDEVEKGQALVILEAMKMENEIAAPEDGTVSSINVATGDTVDSGQLLVSLN
jgi:biotin carboxyl carrier protein